MTSPGWSSCDTEWGDGQVHDEPLLPELTIRGCGLKNFALLVRGAQGAVYSANDASGNRFAVKRLFTQRSDFGIRGVSEGALREATLLTLVTQRAAERGCERDFGVVTLHGVVEAPYKELCLILEMCPLDLSRVVIKRGGRSQGGQLVAETASKRCPILANVDVIRYLVRGIIEILQHLHDECRIVHRDVKLSNFLVREDGGVRLSDFGSARILREDVEEREATECKANPSYDGQTSERGSISSQEYVGYTPVAQRTTMIYQSPECLLGERSYSTGVDMWAAGVVFAELVLQQHLFHSASELSLISDIWKLLGTSSSDDICSSNRGAAGLSFVARTEPTIDLKFSNNILCADGLDLLKKMLEVDPKKRITASDALQHPFLNSQDTGLSLNDVRKMWREKVRQCQEEVTKPIPMGGPFAVFAQNGLEDEDEDDDDDEGVDVCLF
ncbi:unnamed protein product [Trypanosoma congolense IL3000]|uniref:WGS project CAEQ00000000 data, annotated contig 2061 n=1 Tax=Trypanosoma congolense (strain IL3000) TaxID=1068625 RepID=F9WB49_TRYCI|nr:unnamed protein product [Trypanosoma congolense IL3000]